MLKKKKDISVDFLFFSLMFFLFCFVFNFEKACLGSLQNIYCAGENHAGTNTTSGLS